MEELKNSGQTPQQEVQSTVVVNVPKNKSNKSGVAGFVLALIALFLCSVPVLGLQDYADAFNSSKSTTEEVAVEEPTAEKADYYEEEANPKAGILYICKQNPLYRFCNRDWIDILADFIIDGEVKYDDETGDKYRVLRIGNNVFIYSDGEIYVDDWAFSVTSSDGYTAFIYAEKAPRYYYDGTKLSVKDCAK